MIGIDKIEKETVETQLKCRELALYMLSNNYTNLTEICYERLNNIIEGFKSLYNIKKKFENESVSKLVDNYDNVIIEWNLKFDSKELSYIAYNIYKEIKMNDQLKEAFEIEFEFAAIESVRDYYRELSLGDEILSDRAIELYKKIIDRNRYIYNAINVPESARLVWKYSDDFDTIKVGVSTNEQK